MAGHWTGQRGGRPDTLTPNAAFFGFGGFESDRPFCRRLRAARAARHLMPGTLLNLPMPAPYA